MKIIIGLGNPGSKYLLTRHNVGFLAIDHLADALSASNMKSNSNSILAQATLGDEKIILAKPQTFMNLSGKAVTELMHFYKLALEDLLIITDDYYLDFGTIKLLPGGGDGGHNGLKSIISMVGKKFPRLRVGVGDPNPDESFKIPLDQYVLGNFNQVEQKDLTNYLEFLTKISLDFCKFNINDAMNRFNRKTYLNY